MTGALFGDAGPPRARPAQVYPLVDARALDRVLDYAVPGGLDGHVQVGSLVACPLGPRRVLGVVAGRRPATHAGRLAPIAGVVDAPAVPAELWELALWVARYYMAPVAGCLRLVLPPGAEGSLRRTRAGVWRLAAPPRGRPPRRVARLVAGAPAPASARRREVAAALASAGGEMAAAELCRVAGTTMETLRRMAGADEIVLADEVTGPSALVAAGGAPPPRDRPPELNGDQRAALAAARRAIDGGGALLIRGVTGSGKTEVYLGAIEHARGRGRGSLVLVPEIALTPQLLGRLRARLGESVAIWHSAMSRAERAEEFRRVREGEADVVLGARSAVFAPVRDLGLIIVDEEHDASYKQDQTPRYDARQVAARRAAALGAGALFGSATPRPESWAALEHVELPRRVDGSSPPQVEVVDMRTEPPGPLSRPLARALHAAMVRGEKAIVLANRRGYSLMALCRSCGWVARCGDCDVAMVLHRGPDRLSCHHCGAERRPPARCPRCDSVDLARQGVGSQGLEQALAALVPSARLVRMDGSSTATRGAVARLLADFARPGAAILLGTQMVAKGHDLPAVTVAGVIDADAPLQHADFRAEERAFGLIVQAAGRAGRRGEAARAIVQAYEPAARAVQLGSRHAVEDFLAGELSRRRAHDLPPFSHLVRVVLEGEAAEAVAGAARALAEAVRARSGAVGILGPAPMHRLRGRHRRSLLLRSAHTSAVTVPLADALATLADGLARAGIRASVDVDPQDT